MSKYPIEMQIIVPVRSDRDYVLLFTANPGNLKDMEKLLSPILNFIQVKLSEVSFLEKCFLCISHGVMSISFGWNGSNEFQDWLLNLCIELESLERDRQKIVECI